MRIGPILRLLGTLVYGFVGWELGVALAQTREINAESSIYILSAALIGALIGFALAPWLVIAPARAARNSLRQVPIEDLISGLIGLTFGLLIAALLAFPVSRLPTPFGTILPFVGVIIFGYLGAAVMVLREQDLFALLRGDKAPSSNNGNATPGILLLDTSVIIDGRIADIAGTGFLLGKLAVPRFVLNELQPHCRFV